LNPRFSNRGPRNFSRPPSRYARSTRPRKSIDVSRFVNKPTVITEEAEIFTPEHAFNDFQIEESLKNVIAGRKYVTPTPIQDKIIPYILQGRDVVGLANTGTGKTAAFLIPLINKTLKHWDEKTLIMAPTRELATQIHDELKAFSRGLGIYSAVCVGGANMGLQIRELRKGVHFVIGTPGRLKDLSEQGVINFSRFNNVVLDEADRMLDMGFINDMKLIIGQMPVDRQGLFFSATLSPEIQGLIKNFLREPLTISVKTQEVSKNIEQDIIRVSRDKKYPTLVELLHKEEFNKVLIFTRTKHGAQKLAKALSDDKFKADAIHGNKTQGQRQRTLDMFKSNATNILVATDVAARGLDINDISHVINYDAPESQEDYIHRIGRTGRHEKKGKALTFVE
jgi:ATP-dependent RNA helicase RhlE